MTLEIALNKSSLNKHFENCLKNNKRQNKRFLFNKVHEASEIQNSVKEPYKALEGLITPIIAPIAL